MPAQRQKPIDFAAEGLRLALSFDRNCGIRVKLRSSLDLEYDALADKVGCVGAVTHTLR
jgi:hypothetical protein